MLKHVVIAGGTGLIGKRLTELLLQRGYTVAILTRRPEEFQNKPNCTYHYWKVEEQFFDKTLLAHADAVINLAGENIAGKRWTAERKKAITKSRVDAGYLLSEAIIHSHHQIKVFINASAIGWYGEDKTQNAHRFFVETDKSASDFLGQSCKQWERSIHALLDTNIRVVKLRTGIVLDKNGGALKEFLKPIHWGIVPVLGSGKQVMSWIHIDDLVQMYLEVLEHEKYKGVYNAVAPFPMAYKDFIIQLAKAVKGKFYTVMPVPTAFLKLFIGEMSTEILKSTTVSADKMKDAGFVFQYPTLENAFRNIFKK